MEIEPFGTFNTPPESKIASRSDTPTQADFLRMLTTQLQSQDPLSPLEGHEFASQLAVFSQLQELENMNSSLASSLETNLLLTQSINSNMAAALIGKTIKAEVNTVTVGSAGDIPINFELPEAATEITVDILNEDGSVLRSFDVPSHGAGNVHATWDGRDANGVRASEGTYQFRVRALNNEGGEIAVSGTVQGTVSAVNYTDGQVTLTVNGVEVFLSQVLSVMSDQTKKL